MGFSFISFMLTGFVIFPFLCSFKVFRIAPFWVGGSPVNTAISIRVVETNGFIESYDRALFNFGEDDLIDINAAPKICFVILLLKSPARHAIY
jgi:hypothetical protein